MSGHAPRGVQRHRAGPEFDLDEPVRGIFTACLRALSHLGEVSVGFQPSLSAVLVLTGWWGRRIGSSLRSRLAAPWRPCQGHHRCLHTSSDVWWPPNQTPMTGRGFRCRPFGASASRSWFRFSPLYRAPRALRWDHLITTSPTAPRSFRLRTIAGSRVQLPALVMSCPRHCACAFGAFEPAYGLTAPSLQPGRIGRTFSSRRWCQRANCDRESLRPSPLGFRPKGLPALLLSGPHRPVSVGHVQA